MDLLIGAVVFIVLFAAGTGYEHLRRTRAKAQLSSDSKKAWSLASYVDGYPLVGKTPNGYIAFSREGGKWSYIRVLVRRAKFTKVIDAASEVKEFEIKQLIADIPVVLTSPDTSSRLWNRYFL